MKNWVKLERARIDITQNQLADAIGVSVQTINSIEKYRFYPSLVVALKIADYFKMDVRQLFILEEGD
jgi:putative transcriptional regulator